MAQPKFEQAKAYALRRLEKELSPLLTYHSLAHTRDDVVPAAARLAEMNRVDGEDLMLLQTAGYYHDLGFVVQRMDHEAVSVGLAAEILPAFNYSRAQVVVIVKLIMATRLPQTPTNLLEEIMADADLDVLGREDYFLRNQALRAEMENFDQKFPDDTWFYDQYKFLVSHTYFTPTARQLREAGKLQNAAEMLRMYEEARPALMK